MPHYERPVLIASYSIEELRRDAASCVPYIITVPSDRNLKTEIETI